MLMKLCLPHYADHVIGKECFGVWILLNVSSACLDCCIFFLEFCIYWCWNFHHDFLFHSRSQFPSPHSSFCTCIILFLMMLKFLLLLPSVSACIICMFGLLPFALFSFFNLLLITEFLINTVSFQWFSWGTAGIGTRSTIKRQNCPPKRAKKFYLLRRLPSKLCIITNYHFRQFAVTVKRVLLHSDR